MKALSIRHHDIQPNRDYTISPESPFTPRKWEVVLASALKSAEVLGLGWAGLVLPHLLWKRGDGGTQ